MIRLLWLFLILDMLTSMLFAAAWFFGSPTASGNLHDTGYRVLIELAAMAII